LERIWILAVIVVIKLKIFCMNKLPEEVYNKVLADAREYSDQRKLQVAHYDGAVNWAPWYVKYAALESELYGVRAENERLRVRCDKMADKLEEIIVVHKKYHDLNGDNPAANHLMNIALETILCKADAILKDDAGYRNPEGEKGDGKEITIPYTKGEWYLQGYTDAYTNIVRCNNGKGHETLYIASTPQSSLPEARANAKLMAAAPDLLEALRDVIAISDRDHIAWTKAKSAIEKANLNNPH
jgi:hypothetical protein